MMALSGVPLFFSVADERGNSHATAALPRSHAPYYLMLFAGVVLTALYMTRQVIYVFFGNRRAAAERRARKPARDDDASDCSGALRDFLQRRAYAAWPCCTGI